MDIVAAQRQVRTTFVGGFFGQLISAVIWLAAAALGTWRSPRASIRAAVIGGFFIFPLTKLMLRLAGRPSALPRDNPLNFLGMQVALVLPFSMLLLIPVGLFRLNWFFPALLILVGAHYLPFVFLYGMRLFAVLAGAMLAAGILIAMYASFSFSLGAWAGGGLLLLFSILGRASVREAQPRRASA